MSVANVGIAVAGATDAARGASDIVLQKEGLSTIVSAIYGSRTIFKRIETYLTYRMCCSFVFGFAFVLIYCASQYNFPTWTLILMSLLNDFAVASSSKDNVVIQRKPQTLNIWKVAITASTMALISSLQVWGFISSITKYDRLYDERHFFGLEPMHGADTFSGCETAAYTFLVLIITLQLDLIAARSPLPFWYFSTRKDDAGHFTGIPPPSWYVISGISLSLSIATFIAVYWNDTIVIGSGYGMEGVGWRNAGLTWAWAIVWFAVTDLVKAGVVALVTKLEKARAKGKSWITFYQNVFGQYWNEENQEAEDHRHKESLRKRLASYEVASSDFLQRSSDFSSRRGADLFPIALAANLQQIQDEEGAEVPLNRQDALMAVQTLQDDPALLRIISEMAHLIKDLQEEVYELKKAKTE